MNISINKLFMEDVYCTTRTSTKPLIYRKSIVLQTLKMELLHNKIQTMPYQHNHHHK